MSIAVIREMYGVTLVEVLVALLLLSIGLMGMAGMQIKGVKNAYSSHFRSHASLAAEAMAERMRANPAGIQGMNYDGTDSNTIACNVRPAPYCQAAFGVVETLPCANGAEIASFDVFDVACGIWDGTQGVDGVSSLLPSGRLQITCDDVPCTANSMYTITVSWVESELVAGLAQTRTKQVGFRLQP